MSPGLQNKLSSDTQLGLEDRSPEVSSPSTAKNKCNREAFSPSDFIEASTDDLSRHRNFSGSQHEIASGERPCMNEMKKTCLLPQYFCGTLGIKQEPCDTEDVNYKDLEVSDLTDLMSRGRVIVKNTFLEFEPKSPGLRTVHTAAGRLELLAEE